MLIAPTINCKNFKCVKKKIQQATKFLPSTNGWVQLDVADGKFTPNKTWNNSMELAKFLEIRPLKINVNAGRSNLPNIEVHLMVNNPERVIDDWIKAGAKRVIAHLETINTKKSDFQKLRNIKEIGFPKIEIGLAINPETPVEELMPYLAANSQRLTADSIKFVQILAVKPGLAGQKFQPKVLEKIKFLKKNFPKIIIEVDGGINLKTAKLCKNAGADILVAASYIWNNRSPKKALERLSCI